LKKNWKKDYSNKYYNSIENLPVWNWWKISETGNLVYLRKDENYELEEFSLSELWEKIHNEDLSLFPISNESKRVMRMKKKWIEKQAKYLVDGDRFALTEAEIIDINIKDSIDTSGSMSNDEIIIFLEEKLGRELNPKELSVKKYKNYIRYYNKK
jgi:hypothetical protein